MIRIVLWEWGEINIEKEGKTIKYDVDIETGEPRLAEYNEIHSEVKKLLQRIPKKHRRIFRDSGFVTRERGDVYYY